jgi:hypothetical protein
MRDKTLVSAKATNATVHPPMITSLRSAKPTHGSLNDGNPCGSVPKTFTPSAWLKIKESL